MAKGRTIGRFKFIKWPLKTSLETLRSQPEISRCKFDFEFSILPSGSSLRECVDGLKLTL